MNDKKTNRIKRKEKIKIWDVLCKSLDLINRLQTENEHYSRKEKVLAETISNYKSAFEQAQAENERLKNSLAISKKETKRYATGYKTAKAEAYKECVAKVNKIITEIYNKHIFGDNDLLDEEKDAIINFSDDVTSKVDNILKEMVGEDDG